MQDRSMYTEGSDGDGQRSSNEKHGLKDEDHHPFAENRQFSFSEIAQTLHEAFLPAKEFDDSDGLDDFLHEMQPFIGSS